MSITFSYQDGAQSVDEFVAKRGNPRYSYLLYSSLGDLYITKERYQDAAQTYEAFVKRDPIDPNAPLLQVRAIGRTARADSLRWSCPARNSSSNAMASVRHSGPGPRARPVPCGRGRAQSSVKEHTPSITCRSAEDEEAVRVHAGGPLVSLSYLDWFPNEPESADGNFLLAEVLFEAHQYRDATKEYERTAYAYPFNARSAEAAYAALLSYDAYEKQLSDPSQAAEKQAWHAASVDSGLKFATTYPQHKEAANVLHAYGSGAVRDQGSGPRCRYCSACWHCSRRSTRPSSAPRSRSLLTHASSRDVTRKRKPPISSCVL